MKYKNILILGILLVFGLSVCQTYAINTTTKKVTKCQKSKKKTQKRTQLKKKTQKVKK